MWTKFGRDCLRSSLNLSIRRFSEIENPENFKRLRVEGFKRSGVEMYPSGYKIDSSVRSILDRYEKMEKGQTVDKSYKIAGIVTNIRDSGRKLKFVDMLSDGKKIQIKLHSNSFLNQEEFELNTRWMKRGDRVGVQGSPCRTKSGELSLNSNHVTLLAPCLHVLPSSPIENPTKRLSKRYRDILTNPELRRTLVSRSNIIKFIRHFLEEREFMEVETPILGNAVGGASATPFLTYHKEMKLDLFMRIAPELYLKQLIIAGFDRVFEIGKLFRNEGIDASHNPEFTSCEFYMAYADYTDLMQLTQALFSELCQAHNFQPRHGSIELDFIKPYSRLEFLQALESALDTKLPEPADLHHQDSFKFLLDICTRKEIPVSAPLTVPRLLDKLASALLEPNLVQPTFLINHPMIMSPLSKPSPGNPDIAERFELYAGGMELCNAYTELNDPEIQRKTLLTQSGMSDPESMLPDEGFCTALEYGLPPTAGWGCGLDRLTALLTNTTNIRETITFPLIKPIQ
ncbi:lysine--tRNA ligase [Eurytemora carolleeae]|uniref:lysine--tRNA ligase n=1 Tax=Eurytemora carolleeae TaxID=1294199 RepID=UPI000C769FA9|nr:lysine--tRNA ligase [Eurytemora carolleeae]|eukprot:XP_023330626.1 lysine--tRNA ligase-like [Eurytemora affinis]